MWGGDQPKSPLAPSFSRSSFCLLIEGWFNYEIETRSLEIQLKWRIGFIDHKIGLNSRTKASKPPAVKPSTEQRSYPEISDNQSQRRHLLIKLHFGGRIRSLRSNRAWWREKFRRRRERNWEIQAKKREKGGNGVYLCWGDEERKRGPWVWRRERKGDMDLSLKEEEAEPIEPFYFFRPCLVRKAE